MVFVDYGFALSATNKISKNRNNKSYVSKVLGGVLSVQLLIFLICAAIILLFAFTSEKYSVHRLLIIFSIAPILMQSIIPSWFFQGIEKIKYFAAATISAKVFFAITIVLFIEKPGDYIFVPLLTAIGQIIALFLAVIFIYRLGYKIKIPNLRISMYCFKMSRHFFGSRIAEQWIETFGWSLRLNLGRRPYADYEPMAFWGDVSRLQGLLNQDNTIN